MVRCQLTGQSAFKDQILTDAQNLDLRLWTSEPVPLEEAENLVSRVGFAQRVGKLCVRGKVLFDGGLQLVCIARRAERADNIRYFFLRILHVRGRTNGKRDADAI